jgi:hypothetical protein
MGRVFSNLLRVLLRRGWILIPAVLGVTAVMYGLSSSRETKALGEALVVVPTGATAQTPGNALQASKLAQTYTLLIPEDGGVIKTVADAVDRPESDVASRITAVGAPDTFLIRLRYEDDGEQRAIRGTRALSRSVTDTPPAARGVATGSLKVVRLPRLTDVQTAAAGPAIPIGVFLGICLGLLLMIAWERADPRVDDDEALALELTCPATPISHLSEASVGALLDRWIRLTRDDADSRRTPRVGLLAGSAAAESLVEPTAELIATLAERVGRVVAVRDAREDAGKIVAGADLELLVGGAPGSASAGEVVADNSSFAVFVVKRGSNAGELEAAASVLRQFGSQLGWALFIDDVGSLRRVERDLDADAVAVA